MKLLSRCLLLTFIIILFTSSFIFGPPLLNESNYYKQFWMEFFIAGFSILWVIWLWFRNKPFNFKVSMVDLIIVLLLVNYTMVALDSEPTPLVRSLPYYYGLYYCMSKLVFCNLENKDFKVAGNLFLVFVPFVILVHIAIIITQKYGFSSLILSYSPTGSTFGNPDMLGSYLVTLLPFCFIQRQSLKSIGYIVFFVSLIILISIQARSSILAICICGLVWVLLNKPIKSKTIIELSVVSVLLLILLIIWHPESVIGRFFIWFVSIKMITMKPFGWGLFAYDRHYPEFQASYLSTNKVVTNLLSPEVVHSPFNEFLNMGATIGLTGLMLVILLAVFIFYYGIKSKDWVFFPVLSFFIICLSYFPFKISPLVSFIIPLIALISNRSQNLIQMRFPKWFFNGFLILIMFSSLFLTFECVRVYSYYRKWHAAYLFSQDELGIIESERLFSELYPVMKRDGRFLITYSNLRYRRKDYEEALQLLEEAEGYFCDVTLSLKLAKIYEMQGFHEKAKKKYDLAINLSPNNLAVAYERILFLQNIGESEEAYLQSIELVNKPIRGTSSADPFLIKSQLKKLIINYEQSQNAQVQH